MPLVCPKGVGWGNMGYLIPEVAPGDWAIEILEVQILIYAPMCPWVGHNIDRRIMHILFYIKPYNYTPSGKTKK